MIPGDGGFSLSSLCFGLGGDREVATRMDVKAMPTFLLVKDSAPLEKVIGANPEEIKKRIDGFVQSIHFTYLKICFLIYYMIFSVFFFS